MPDPLVISSPDQAKTASLTLAGEIRFGPPYYSLVVENYRFLERIFGDACLWSPDSRYFAIQEWETIQEAGGPQTHLLLIDVDTKRECVVSRAENGFIVPLKFKNNNLIYRKEYFVPPAAGEYEIEFLALNGWETLQ